MIPGPTGPTGPTPVGPTGPLVPSMSAGHTDVPMPFAQMTVPGYVPTAEEQQNEIPKSQATWKHVEMLRRLVEILLLQWAWLKSWLDLVVYGLKLRDARHLSERFDIQFLAPTVVIVVGIVMTNVLGFINFFLQGLHLDACMAAFDLDTPFLACKHGAQVVKGEDCPEWEKLRMRNSIWRSLPLAMITLVLSLRNLFEIPTCQIFAVVGPLATSILPGLETESRFIQDIHDDAKLNLYDIGQFAIFRLHAARFSWEQKEAVRNMVLDLLDLESAAWDAAHCSDSAWEETKMMRDQDVSENWLMGVPQDLDNVEFGGIGSGNLASLNAVLVEQSLLALENMKDEIKPILKKNMGRVSRTMLETVPWRLYVRKVAELLQARKEGTPRITLVQSRPWKLNIGDLVHLEIKSGWKVRVFQAFGLLLVAALPILKKILAACKVRPGQLFIKSIVGLYVLLDLACLVMAWLLCASAPVAYHAGAALKVVASAPRPVARETMKHLKGASEKNLYTSLSGALGAATAAMVPELVSRLMPKLKGDLLPAIKCDLAFFIPLAAGSLVFLAASAVLAFFLCGARLTAGLSAAVSGPLWLMSEDAGRDGTKSSATGLYFMVVFRSLFIFGMVGCRWMFVEPVSAQVFFAMICNQILSMTQATYWLTSWAGICAVHCLCGLAAAYAAKQNLEESSEAAHGGDCMQATYGTFDPTV